MSSTSVTPIQFPPYGLSFDPSGTGNLAIVGGGGRERTGVKNMVAVFDLASSHFPTLIGEHEIPDGDDNPTTVAVFRKYTSSALGINTTNSADQGKLVILSGVNSSKVLCEQGINRSLRSFEVRQSTNGQDDESKTARQSHENTIATSVKQKKEPEPYTLPSSIVPTGAAQLFSTLPNRSDKLSTYQQALTISKAGIGLPPPAGHIAAVASVLSGSKNEVVIFNAQVDEPKQEDGDIIATCLINSGEEVNAIDIIQTKPEKKPKLQPTASSFQIVANTKREVHIGRVSYDFKSKKVIGRQFRFAPIFSTPLTGTAKTRDLIRFVRFLTDELVLVLSTSGDRLLSTMTVLKISWNGDSADVLDLVLKQQLPTKLGGFCNCDVIRLGQDLVTGDSQAVLATTFLTQTMALFTFNLRHNQLVGGVQTVKIITGFHNGTVTGVALSPVAAANDTGESSETKTASLKMASCTISCNVAIHDFPLTKVLCEKAPVSSASATATAISSTSPRPENNRKLDPRQYRYVLRPQSTHPISSASALAALMVVFGIFIALLLGGNVASSLPAGVSKSPAFARMVQPIENLQALVQGRPSTILHPAYLVGENDDVGVLDPLEKITRQHQRRRNVYTPGSQGSRGKLHAADELNGNLGHVEKVPEIEKSGVSEPNRRDLAEDVKQMLDDAPVGSFFLLHGEPAGNAEYEGAKTDAERKP